MFVHHGGRHVGEARLVDSYANARVRRADLRLDPAGDDDNDVGGAPVARNSDSPDDPLPPAAASRVTVSPSTDRSQEQSR